MKTNKPKASHVNTGTSIPRAELAQPATPGPVMRPPKTQVETKSDSKTTGFGGLILVVAFLRQMSVSKILNDKVSVLKQHQPFTEADHILALAVNLYVGGTCLEDMANLQHNEAIRRILGAPRLPDPTTAGDFLRRFDPKKNPGALEGLRQATDELQRKVWDKKTKKGKKQELAVIDIDGHLKEVYGAKKEGADFTYKGKWAYHPLLISMATTGEILAIRNRPGNVRSGEGAAEALDETLRYIKPSFNKILVRGDSDFDRRDMHNVCEEHDAYFAFVGREFPNRPGIALSIPESEWQPFLSRPKRRAEAMKKLPSYRPRKKKPNRRREQARKRKFKELKLLKQWIAEVPWSPPKSDKTYRLVIRRQLIERREKGQTTLFREYRYRYIVTNLPESVTTTGVVDLTYERCDQENVIAQMNDGLAAWKMPVQEFAGNSAWLEIARLAWNLAKWIAQLALPAEVVRWEWKRFRNAFVFLTAEVIKRSRQLWVRLSESHRFLKQLLAAHDRLQC